MKASVDKDLCASCGVCVEVCPDVFEMDADEKAQSKVDVVPAEAEDACREAADQCPTEAITIEDA
jgi:ferredoxin